MMDTPLDHPTPDRPHRLYVAVTNHCNRECPWCSTCSSPRGSTFLTVGDFLARLPTDGPFEVQLEGGEPTVHPQFFELVRLARAHPRCTRLILCTNGVALPRDAARLERYLDELGRPLTIKISVNHHLLDRDPGLLALCQALRDRARDAWQLVINVRLRKGVEDDDRRVRAAVEAAGLAPHANVFFLQRYGFASDETEWDEPFLAGTRFSMINPDGRAFGPELIARSEAMRVLP